MPSKKVKIEVSDNTGGNFSISYSGEINRDKVLQLLDFVELLGGSNTYNSNTKQFATKFDRVVKLIQTHYPVGPFTSSKVQENYEKEFNEPISLSTVSTYFSRLISRDIITYVGPSKRCYRMKRMLVAQEKTIL
ncbi:hypothetical protein A3K70_01535 [Candidatus Bathyarchaeota archaeon RBG_16_48_13]|nr:MAG: hypothetical protein A3K70_01535 [Candidatus Bathyarchaeota archaeon RBG_16_48_13]